MKTFRFILVLTAAISFSARSQCVFDSDCDDGIVCTHDVCNAPNCSNTPSNALCEDGIACTADVCSNFQCTHAPNNTLCTDGNACNGTETCDVFLGCKAGTPITANVSIASSPNMPSCNGTGQTVTFTAIPVNGGTPVYQWKKNGNNVGTNSNAYASATLLNGDQVWCEMTSSATCVAGLTVTSNIITVTLFDPPVVTITTTTESSCCNGKGTALANPSSGIPPYTYRWNNSRTTQLITSLHTGNYRVTVADAQGCTAAVSASINDQAPGISASFSVTNPDCVGNQGSITVNPVGGEPPYTFQWSNGSTSQTINNLSGYFYSVTITDAFMCYRTSGTNLTHPPQISISANTTNVTCNGWNDGSIQLAVTGGSPAYSYSWNIGATTMDLNNIPAGNYSVTVTDSNGCTTTTNRNIYEPTAFSGNITALPLNCFGSNDGTAVLYASGGTSPYTRLWSTGETTWSIDNLSAGMYCATATDANGCWFDACATVNEPPQIMLSPSASPPQIQAGQSSNLSVTGCNVCTYSWNPATGLNNSGISNPVASPTVTTNYTVIAIDANGCTASASLLVTVGSGLLISGVIKTETGVFIPGVSVDLTGTSSGSYTTMPYPGNGQYSLGAAANGSYAVTPSKNNDISVRNGVSTLDIILMRGHVLSVQLLGSPYKIIAADVNATAPLSAPVTTADILLVRSLILGNIQSFPNGRLWAFVSSDFVIANPQFPFPYDNNRTYTNLSSIMTNQNFIGVKLGDVNNSWDPATPKTEAIGNVQFVIDEYTAMPGNEIIVPVKVKDFNSVTGYQFTLSWDSGVLSLLEVNNKELSGYYGEHGREEGYLTTSWNDDTVRAISLVNDDTVFELRFKVIGAEGTRSPIKIGSELTISEAYSENLDLLNIIPQNGMVKVGEGSSIVHYPSSVINLQVQPNPFTNSTNIVFTLPQDETVTLSIYDILGREVKQVKALYRAGEHHMEWTGDDAAGNELSKGLYHVRMITGENLQSVKVILLR